MLLDSNGNIVRAGVEGMYREDAPFWVQVPDMQKSMENKTLRKLFCEERRTDLPGQPLVWQKRSIIFSKIC